MVIVWLDVGAGTGGRTGSGTDYYRGGYPILEAVCFVQLLIGFYVLKGLRFLNMAAVWFYV